MNDVGQTASARYYGWPAELAPVAGAGIAVIVAAQYGRPTHAMITLWAMLFMAGLGVTLGFHRLFSHRSFTTFRSVECALMILGCTAGGAPFFWIATHRAHHRHSDREGDPHSPHIWAGRPLSLMWGFWHSYFEWLHSYGYAYEVSVVRDLIRRPDLVWIDRHWFSWYLIGLAVPGVIGFGIGGTLYDALIGIFSACRWDSRSTLCATCGALARTIPAIEAEITFWSGCSPSARVGITIIMPILTPLDTGFTGGSPTSLGVSFG